MNRDWPVAERRLSACISGVFGGCGLLAVLFFGGVVVVSLIGNSDPHHHGVVGAVVLGFPCAIMAATMLPAAFPPRIRDRAYAVAFGLFVVVVALGCLLLTSLM